MADLESEKSPTSNASLNQTPTSRRTDQMIDAVDKMTLGDLQKPDSGLKMLIALYKEACEEKIRLHEKINALNIKSSDLSNKLSVARERLKHLCGKGLVIAFLNIIAGALLSFVTMLPENQTRTILFSLSIAIFIVCGLYQGRVDGAQKDITDNQEEK